MPQVVVNRVRVQGTAAVASPPAGNPVAVGGTDGTNMRTLLVDGSGRPLVSGAAASGAAVTGNPVLVGGSDGTNARSLLVDASGRPLVSGAAANGAAVAGNPVRTAGSDGTNTRDILTDTSGRQRVVGGDADGAAVTADPVLMGGQDGTNAQALLTDTSGRPNVVGAAPAGSAVAGNPLLMGGSDGTNARNVAVEASGVVVTEKLCQAIHSGRVAGLVGRIAGKITTSATTEVAIRATTYTEQTSNAQRSVSSNNAADASAGTGARTIRITYYSVSGSTITGPFTEDLTLNGTTPVNTASSTIAYIEKIEVLTVGSGATNAGIITLFAATAGGGGAVASIAVGDMSTFYAHHYVPSGKACYITDLWAAHDNSGDPTIFNAKSLDVTVSDAAQMKVLDFFAVLGLDGAKVAGFQTPREVVGPARITLFAIPPSTSTNSTVEATFYEI